MMISTIILVVLRMYSVTWLLQGLSLTISFFTERPFPGNKTILLLSAAKPLIILLLAAVSWFAAPFLSRRILAKQDTSVSLAGLSLRDLYAFAFVFLGLYFALSSLANTLLWLYYSLRVAATTDFNPERQKSLYELFQPLMTLVAGLFSIFNSRRWANKLAA